NRDRKFGRPDSDAQMNESGCSVRSRAKSGAAVLLALGFLLVFLDAIAVTWYLWKLPASSFGQLDKVLRGLGGWVSAALGFLGIKHTIDRSEDRRVGKECGSRW